MISLSWSRQQHVPPNPEKNAFQFSDNLASYFAMNHILSAMNTIYMLFRYFACKCAVIMIVLDHSGSMVECRVDVSLFYYIH